MARSRANSSRGVVCMFLLALAAIAALSASEVLANETQEIKVSSFARGVTAKVDDLRQLHFPEQPYTRFLEIKDLNKDSVSVRSYNTILATLYFSEIIPDSMVFHWTKKDRP